MSKTVTGIRLNCSDWRLFGFRLVKLSRPAESDLSWRGPFRPEPPADHILDTAPDRFPRGILSCHDDARSHR
jgi:hypothetical protein